MQERRNKILMTSLVVLVAVTVVVWLLQGRGDNFEVDKRLFNNFDAQSIDEVTLQSGSGAVNLKFDGSRWTVNEQYAADPAMIEVLFATVLQAEPKRPVASAQQDSIAHMLRSRGVQVNLLSSGRSLVEFAAGGNAAKTQAIFVRKDQTTPYVVVIPGYRVYTSGIFELNESSWRDKRIFAFNWRLNFQQLETRYSGSSSDGVNITLKDQFLTVEGVPVVDSTRLNQYLNDVSQMAAEEFVSANRTLDSVGRTTPAMTIAVRAVGRAYTLDLFRYVDSNGRVAGLLNGKQWVLFSRQTVTSVSRPRRFFEAKP